MDEVFDPLDQIVYDDGHGKVEYGFVTSVRGKIVFCRYWNKDFSDLRTKSCSEGTPIDKIKHHKSMDDLVVLETYSKYYKEVI